MRLLPILTLLVAAGTAVRAHACSCDRPATAAEGLHAAAAVFQGEVVQVRKVPGQGGEFDGGTVATVKVQRAWKGSPPKLVDVASGTGLGDCGIEFAVGKGFLVYADAPADGGMYGTGTRLETSTCTRTGLAAERADDAEVLERLLKSYPPAGGCGSCGAGAGSPLAVLILLAWRTRPE